MTSWYGRRLQRIRPGRESLPSSPAAITESLRRAWEHASAEQLTAALTRRVLLTIDSGCETPGLPGVVTGRADVAAALFRLGEIYLPTGLGLPAGFESAEVNGRPGIALRSGRRVVGVVAVATRATRVDQLWAVVNADKLTHWNAD